MALYKDRVDSFIRKPDTERWRPMSKYAYLTDAQLLDIIDGRSEFPMAYNTDHKANFLVFSTVEEERDRRKDALNKLTTGLMALGLIKPASYIVNELEHVHTYVYFESRPDHKRLATLSRKWLQSLGLVDCVQVLSISEPKDFPLQADFTWISRDLSPVVRRRDIANDAAIAMFLSDIKKSLITPMSYQKQLEDACEDYFEPVNDFESECLEECRDVESQKTAEEPGDALPDNVIALIDFKPPNPVEMPSYSIENQDFIEEQSDGLDINSDIDRDQEDHELARHDEKAFEEEFDNQAEHDTSCETEPGPEFDSLTDQNMDEEEAQKPAADDFAAARLETNRFSRLDLFDTFETDEDEEEPDESALSEPDPAVDVADEVETEDSPDLEMELIDSPPLSEYDLFEDEDEVEDEDCHDRADETDGLADRAEHVGVVNEESLPGEAPAGADEEKQATPPGFSYPFQESPAEESESTGMLPPPGYNSFSQLTIPFPDPPVK